MSMGVMLLLWGGAMATQALPHIPNGSLQLHANPDFA